MGNYHCFGHNKFIPELSQEVFKQILQSNPLYSDDANNALYKEVVNDVYPQVEREIFNISEPFSQLNYPEDGGVTGYYSRNMTKEDLSLVQEFLDS